MSWLGSTNAYDEPIALGWLLEEIHVTWAQLEKKRTRPRLYTNYLEENQTVAGDDIANHKRRRQDYSKDGVKDFQTASERSRLKETLEDWRRC
ncbi:hypothetical protein Tco_0058216 [Tanacetum coccineum]